MSSPSAARPAVVTSLLLHGGMLLAVGLSWPFLSRPPEPTPEPVPVELISALPASPVLADTPATVADPVTETAADEVWPTPPSVQDAPPPMPIDAALPTPPAEAETIPDLNAPALKAPTPPKPINTAALPQPIEKAVEKPTEKPVDKPASKPFDLDAIAKSVGPPKTSGGAKTQSAAVSTSELEALKAKMYQCWNPDCGAVGAERYAVRARVTLGRDGQLSRPPELLDRAQITASGRLHQAAAERALRAIERCAPYGLSEASYDNWKDIVMRFDPKEVCSP